MTVTVGSSTALGSYPIIVTGNGGGIQQTTTVTLTVTTGVISYVQGNYATPQSPQTTVNIPLPRRRCAGDLNVVAVGWNDSTATVSSVKDTLNNSYTLAVGPTVQAGVASQSIYYAKNIAASGRWSQYRDRDLFHVRQRTQTFGSSSTEVRTRSTQSM